MNRIIKSDYLKVALTFVFLSLVFVLSVPAQKGPPNPFFYPHDFNDVYYKANGVYGDQIIWRRSGSDGLSVFDKYMNPIASKVYNSVRVIVTVPAYDENAGISYWYPLGELTNAAFTQDKTGIVARENAKLFPMYIFPDEKYINYNTIAGTRQAPLIDNTWTWNAGAVNINPLGLRELFLVTYTAKAHSKEGAKMMDFMAQKNGRATDNTPIINSVPDIQLLLNDGFITMETVGDGPDRGHFAVAPMITDPTHGVIAKDAFIWMSSRNGTPLESEMLFFSQFKCLQKLGTYCK